MSASRVEQLLAELDLPERIRLLAGRDYWHTEPIERVGIGSVQLSDGPVGVRGERTTGSVSVSFPCGTAIGATFDRSAAAALGDVLAEECVSKGVQVLLGPTINLQRHPLGGRHFECYAEDPILTADLAVAYVKALQARGIAATIKHFVANDSRVRAAHHQLRGRRPRPSLALPRAVRRGSHRWRGVGGHVLVQPHKRHLRSRARASSQRSAPERVALRRASRVGLVRGSEHGPVRPRRPRPQMPGPPIHYGKRLEAAVAAGEVPEEVIAERARPRDPAS